MTEQPQPTNAIEHIEFALQSLRKAVAGERTLGNVVVALDAVRRAANCSLPTEASEFEPELQSLFSAVGPILAPLVAPHVNDDLVYWGLGSASWLLRPDDGCRQDRYSMTVLLWAELTAFYHRNKLAERGNRLQRLVHCRLAMLTPYDPSMPLN